jgi:hypothetical protein
MEGFDVTAISRKPASGKAAPSSIQVGLLDILVSDRLRPLRPEAVDEIADSFKTLGQLQPIVVRQVKPSKISVANYVLVAGVHRVEAARKLGWKTIAAVVIDGVDAELAEIDENLVRADLSPAERKVHIGLRKTLYEAKHPETKHGAVGRGGKSSKDEISFVEDTAHKTGRGRSTVARDAKHAKTVAVLGEIPGTSLDSDSEIEALSKLPVQEQRDLAEQAKAGIEVTAKPAAPAHATPPDEIDTSSPASTADLSLLLQWVLLALNNPKTNAVTAVASVGPVHVREIIDGLKKALDEYSGNALPLSMKADRAESDKKPALGKDAIKEMADAAELKTIKAPPAADEFPDLPAVLDRRPKPPADIDQEAAEIAEQAAREKKWLDS